MSVGVCVHADNAVRITLNGTLVGQQPDVVPRVRTVLLAGHREADAQLDQGRIRAGCGLLLALDAGISARGRAIPAADAATMRTLIAEARSTYGC